MIIDFHIHIHPYPTETNGVRMPKAYGDRNAARMARMGIAVDRQAAVAVERMTAAGVDAAVVQNPFHAPQSGHVRTNQSVYDAIHEYAGQLFGFAGIMIHPQPDLAELEFAVTQLGFKGLKYLPASQDFAPNDFDLLDPLYRKLIELDVPLLSHASGTFFPGSNPWQTDMRAYYDVVRRYPELKLVIAHLGHNTLGGLETAISVVNSSANAYLEASGAVWNCAMDFIPPRGASQQSAWESFTHDILFPETDDGEMLPEYREAWEKTVEAHAALLRHVVNRAPGKLIYGTDLPFIARFDFWRLYVDALGDGELLAEVLAGTAQRLLKL